MALHLYCAERTDLFADGLWCRTLATHLGHLTMTPTNPNCGAADATRWLLKRELFYTAVTRAKAKIGVVGSESLVRAAVERRSVRYIRRP